MTYRVTEPFDGKVHVIEATDGIAAIRAILLAHGAPSSIADAEKAARDWLTVVQEDKGMTKTEYDDCVESYNKRVTLAFQEYFWLLDSGWTMQRATEKMDYELANAYKVFKESIA